MRKRETVASGALLAFLAAVSAAGCRQLTGIDDDPRPPDQVADGGGDSGDAEAPSCDAGFASACEVDKCGGYVYADPACGACGVASCCAESASCVGNTECSALAACERSCEPGADTCLLSCELAHPDGVSAGRAFGTCLATNCATSCVQPQWACLKHPTTPAPPAGPISITYTFGDYVTLRPVPGLTVRACGETDNACASPLVSATTDEHGVAVLQLAATSFKGYAEIRGGDYGPVLLWLPPLSKSFVTPSLGIATNTIFMPIKSLIAPVKVDSSTLLVRAHDCAGAPAAGVHFQIDGDGTPFYFANGTPSKTATVTDGQGTVTGGYGGFVNVTPLISNNVVATVPQLGLSYAPRAIAARPGSMGYTEVVLYAAPP